MAEETFIVQEDELSRETRMGIGSWRPQWLQKINTILSFTAILSIASFLQVFITGMTSLNLQTIETEFGFVSKYSGLIMAGNDISALLLVMIVSFFGDKASKPKWIGIGCIITGFGVILFALPKLLIGKYKTYGIRSQSMFLCLIKNENSTMADSECVGGADSSSLHVAIFFLSQFIIGAGATPLQTLGPAYLDENVSPQMSPIYLGVWFLGNMLGPPFGMIFGGIFLKTHTDIEKPENMEVDDPRWVGAWWLGYVSFAGCFLLIGIIMVLFPKRMDGKQQKKREASIKAGHLPSSDEKIKFTFKGYFIATFKLLTNKVFVVTVMALSAKLLYSVGLLSFLIKILILKFGVSPPKAGFITGITLMPSLIIGILGGSFIMKRLKVEVAAKTAGKICFIFGFITMANAFMFYLPGCSNTNLAGVITPYHNRTITGSVDSICNSECKCKENVYLPICGSDGKVYHSPCHAGCEAVALKVNERMTKLEQVFGNCSCFAETTEKQKNDSNDDMMVNFTTSGIEFSTQSLRGMTPQQQFKYIGSLPSNTRIQLLGIMKLKIKSFFNKASMGKCDRGCKNFYYFILLVILWALFSLLGSTPHKIMVLRCVPDNQRSFALGAQFVIMRSISFLPGPILIGAILDAHCLSWDYNECGKKASCLDYNMDDVSHAFVMFGVSVSVISTMLYLLAWWWYPDNAKAVGNQLIDDKENEREQIEL